MTKDTIQDDTFKYSKTLSSLFCSVSILALSVLCLLNSLSIDFYSMLVLLKVVLPASFCFWFLGFTIGKILDSLQKEDEKAENEFGADDKAYEIPSMFNIGDGLMDTDSNSNSNDMGIL